MLELAPQESCTSQCKPHRAFHPLAARGLDSGSRLCDSSGLLLMKDRSLSAHDNGKLCFQQSPMVTSIDPAPDSVCSPLLLLTACMLLMIISARAARIVTASLAKCNSSRIFLCSPVTPCIVFSNFRSARVNVDTGFAAFPAQTNLSVRTNQCAAHSRWQG